SAEAVLTQSLDVLLTLDHEQNCCVENCREIVEHLPRGLLPDPTAAAVGMTLGEVLLLSIPPRLIPEDLIEECALFVGVVILGDEVSGFRALAGLPICALFDFRMDLRFRPEPAFSQRPDYVLLPASGVAMNQDLSALIGNRAARVVILMCRASHDPAAPGMAPATFPRDALR